MERLEQDVELGAQAEAFLTSNLGRRIAQLAGEEIDRCLMELKTVDIGCYSGQQKVRELQDTIRRNETLGKWIVEVIHQGREAKAVLADEES